MQISRFNPFNELYVGETVSSFDFVELFSPALLPVTGALFLPGNVVLKGVQGSGKSMLLNLLKPEVRIAYERSGEPFPLRGRYARFIAAGINLITSNAIAFGQRAVQDWGEDKVLPIFFGDFLNCWVVFDLLQTIESLRDGLSKASVRMIELKTDREILNDFAQQLAAAKCWFGYFDGIASYRDFKKRLELRINSYLAFLNFNLSAIPQDIQRTKTSIGEPISQAAELLRRSGIIPESVHVLVSIDQHEELFRLEGRQKELGPLYRSVIIKALGLRNPHVSYRIGTRGFAWTDVLEFWGTSSRLEQDRNYKLIDLDEMLRRRENRKTWIFPTFAEDVFARRIHVARYDLGEKEGLLNRVFGKGPTPDERARVYCRNGPDRVLRFDSDWPDRWKKFLRVLADKDPLSARLAEAWARQRGKSGVIRNTPEAPYSWDTQKYWKKERIQAALMQIAARCSQRMMWAGTSDILELSGGNILVFVSLCQHIWGAWLLTEPEPVEVNASPLIPSQFQSVGIHEASTLWFNKITEEPGSDIRQRFVNDVAILMQKSMHEDSALSYPGHNGFSVDLKEYGTTEAEDIRTFLQEAVAYGVLLDFPHTTKSRNRRQRRKWYLNPIYSPHFKLPHIHTKEPIYVRTSDVRAWMQSARDAVMPGVPAKSVGPQKQGKLFGNEELERC
jgi:hypothetical protein